MKKSTDVTVEILKDIRSELKTTNSRIDTLREELGRRIVDSELRTATAITELAGTMRDMTAVLKASADLRPRVEKCEHDIDELKRRLPEAS